MNDRLGLRHGTNRLVEFGGYFWCSNLAFRDALRADDKLRIAYQAMKQQAVAAAPQGRAANYAQKQAFIDAAKARLLAP